MRYEDIIGAIRSLANGHTEIKNADVHAEVSELLYKHNCRFLLSRLNISKEIATKLQAEYMLNKISINQRYATCKNIFEQLTDNSIIYSVIKGAVLSKSAYDDIYARNSGDIDLLINRNNVDHVKQVLLDNGFIQGRISENGITPFSRKELLFQSTMSHQIAPFVKSTENKLCPYVNVDINTDIFWGESDIKTDLEYVLSETQDTVICNVSVKKLSLEMEFVALCLHHYKDMNSIYLLSQGSLKLRLFCDIYFYLINNQLDIDKLISICNTLCSTKYIYYCIYYTNKIFNSDIHQEYLHRLCAPDCNDIPDTFGLTPNEVQEWKISFTERLFHSNINGYLMSNLSDRDIEKIQTNISLGF